MPHTKEQAKLYAREYRKKNPGTHRKNEEVYQERRARRYQGRIALHRSIIHNLQVHYGCMNPHCLWQGEFEACDLDYHHVGAKTGQVSQMASCSLEKIAEEVNNCTVLCAICHRRLHKGYLLTEDLRRCRVRVEGDSLVTIGDTQDVLAQHSNVQAGSLCGQLLNQSLDEA